MMKKIVLPILLFVAVFAACSTTKSGSQTGTVEVSGAIEKMGMTTFQYGTHMLKGVKSYALKSTTVNLDSYVGKTVKITGTKVEGYPVENGPEFIEVTEVKDK